jgi:hypothetical protein
MRDPSADLLLVTTTSALGRSSTYNRLKDRDGQLAFRSVGFTRGTGDFHLSGPLYDQLRAFAGSLVESSDTYRNDRWGGTGFRNRRETLQRALDGLGLNGDGMRVHGIRREVFVAPLAGNAREILAGGQSEAAWYERSTEQVATWWRDRWAAPRARECDLDFDPDSWRLWSDPPT